MTFPFTAGNNKYDFINVYELAQLISIAVMLSEVNAIINVCKSESISFAERIELFIKEHNLMSNLSIMLSPIDSIIRLVSMGVLRRLMKY